MSNVSYISKKLQITVFGSDSDHCSRKSLGIAEKVGKEIAKSGSILLTGGLQGVMKAASKGARENGGEVIGILPGDNKQDANEYCSIIVPTEIGFARAQVLANSADAVIVVEGGGGTIIEVCEAYWRQLPIISIQESGGTADRILESYSGYMDKRNLTKIKAAISPEEAVKKAFQIGRNRLDLQQRLKEVGLDLNIYKKKPPKYIRVNPRNLIGISDLEMRLNQESCTDADIKFEETSIPGIYRSSETNIGGMINGCPNNFFMTHYFIQDFASALVVYVLNLEKGNTFLDLCAAPGFKTILAYDFLGGDIDITALDVDERRYNKMRRILGEQRVNAKVYLRDGITFVENKKYDRVLVDAECSCEGMVVKYDSNIEKDVSGIDSVTRNSQEDILRYAQKQLELLQNGFNNLRVGGVLVYSTCAMNKYENEDVIRQFLERNPNAKIELPDMKPFENDLEFIESNYGIRIIPGKTKGIYFTRICKNE